MLQKLLAEIKKGGTLNPSVLAARIGASPALVEMMLEDLERRGMLSRLAASCSAGGCTGCASTAGCTPRVWVLH